MTVSHVPPEASPGTAAAVALRDAAEAARELAVVLARLAALHEQEATTRAEQRRRRARPVRSVGSPTPAESLRGRAEVLAERLRVLPGPPRSAREAGLPLPAAADSAGTGWGSLTRAERQVVRTVAAGRTNREAADVLSLSPHTVNSHLRHVYAKLGISSRIVLVRIAVAHEVPGTDLDPIGGRLP